MSRVHFAASNAEPTPSLHHLSDQSNQYEVAIQAVGEIIENFISDGVFKVYGFGAVVPDKGLLYDFNVNLTSSNPDCTGVEGQYSYIMYTLYIGWD